VQDGAPAAVLPAFTAAMDRIARDDHDTALPT
jgi:hypothetical protein